MADPITPAVTAAVSTAKADLTKVEATVKADLAKTYAGKIVALAFAAGLVVGFLVHFL